MEILKELFGDVSPEQIKQLVGEVSPEENRRRMIINYQKACMSIDTKFLMFNGQQFFRYNQDTTQFEPLQDTVLVAVMTIAPEISAFMHILTQDSIFVQAIHGIIELMRQALQSGGYYGVIFDFEASENNMNECFYTGYKDGLPIYGDINDILKVDKIKTWLIEELTKS